MNDKEPIEGEIVSEQPGRALATRQASTVAQWTPSFAVSIDEAVSRVEAKHQFFKRVMRQGDHYGSPPGVADKDGKGAKPTLLKPGAELLLANMGLNAEFDDDGTPILDVIGATHGGEPFIWYRRRCKIYRQIGPTEAERMLVAQASGSCNSWEKKYRYRNAERICPECGKAAIIAGKPEFNRGVPNWVCYKKKDGCGTSFAKDDPRFGGDVGKVPNPDVLDIENTILKMADKRALVAATLLATGCSDIFTQDLEDLNPPPPPAADEPPAPPLNTEAQTRINAQVRALLNAFIVQIPEAEVRAIVERAQRENGNPPTGDPRDLFVPEGRVVYAALKEAVANLTGASA